MYIKSLLKIFFYWRKHPIASKSISQTLIRFLRWQIGSRILNTPIVWKWFPNTQLIIEKGMTGATMNIYCGLHEFFDMGFLLHFLRPEDTFVDIGANVGTYTILSSSVIGARSISIEPVPKTFENLKRNININNVQSKVKLVCNGIGESDEQNLLFSSDNDTTNKVISSDYKGASVAVSMRTLDSILNGETSIFWKIDVEGYEENVLNGALKTISSNDLKVIEIENLNSKIELILHENGFSRYNYDPITRNFEKSPTIKFGHNWLYIKDIDFVRERCIHAPQFKVLGLIF